MGGRGGLTNELPLSNGGVWGALLGGPEGGEGGPGGSKRGWRMDREVARMDRGGLGGLLGGSGGGEGGPGGPKEVGAWIGGVGEGCFVSESDSRA